MTIAALREKCNTALARIPRDVRIVLLLVAASGASFGLGYHTGLDEARQGRGESENEITPIATSPLTATDTTVVASQFGSKYYLQRCAGAVRITAKNKVTFASAAEARKAGYSPASNCPGLDTPATLKR